MVAHRYTYALPRCRTSLYRRDFYSPISVFLERSCWPRIIWCGTGGFQEQGQCFLISLSCVIPTMVFYYFSLSLLSVNWLVLWGWGLRTDKVDITLFQPCTADLFLIIMLIIDIPPVVTEPSTPTRRCRVSCTRLTASMTNHRDKFRSSVHHSICVWTSVARDSWCWWFMCVAASLTGGSTCSCGVTLSAMAIDTWNTIHFPAQVKDTS